MSDPSALPLWVRGLLPLGGAIVAIGFGRKDARVLGAVFFVVYGLALHDLWALKAAGGDYTAGLALWRRSVDDAIFLTACTAVALRTRSRWPFPAASLALLQLMGDGAELVPPLRGPPIGFAEFASTLAMVVVVLGAMAERWGPAPRLAFAELRGRASDGRGGAFG